MVCKPPTKPTIVIATGNPGKLREIDVLLEGLGVRCSAQSEFGVEPGPETGDTFVANAIQKAVYAAAATGLPAIADDSGLVVDALDGRPGIFSARYAGPSASDEENVDKLLTEMENIEERAAHFHCAAVYVRGADDARPVVAEASWHGVISRERSGQGGFGYDPVFYLPELKCTSAELPAAQKNALSHRGMAFRALREQLREVLGAEASRP